MWQSCSVLLLDVIDAASMQDTLRQEGCLFLDYIQYRCYNMMLTCLAVNLLCLAKQRFVGGGGVVFVGIAPCYLKVINQFFFFVVNSNANCIQQGARNLQ